MTETRRAFVKKAAYAAPAILTMQATSGVAKAGSEKHPGNGGGTDLNPHKKPKKSKKNR